MTDRPAFDKTAKVAQQVAEAFSTHGTGTRGRACGKGALARSSEGAAGLSVEAETLTLVGENTIKKRS